MYKKISSYKSRIFILKRTAFVGVFILLACHQYSEKHLRVAVASNLQYRMTEVVQLFETQYNVKVDVVVASSGKLTHQITQGAPFDVFCGADTVYTNYIKQHMNLQHDIHIFSHGMLIFWSKQPIDSSKGIDILTDKRVLKIAIPNPKYAPIGQRAMEVLEKATMYHLVQHKLVYGESVGQVNQWVENQTVSVGITEKSVCSATGGFMYLIPKNTYQPIKQSCILLSKHKLANRFIQFLIQHYE